MQCHIVLLIWIMHALSWRLFYDTHRSTFTPGRPLISVIIVPIPKLSEESRANLKGQKPLRLLSQSIGSPDTELVLFARIYLLQCFVWSIVFVFFSLMALGKFSTAPFALHNLWHATVPLLLWGGSQMHLFLRSGSFGKLS